MQISDLLRQYNNAANNSQGVSGKKGVEKLVSSLQELPAGNVFEGTVKSMKNGQVVLALSNGQKITARMDGKVPLQEGQSMFFQVKSNDGQQIAIRPFTMDGNSVNLTLLQALKAANLPVDGNHLSMVNQMMQEQMSIDKNSLGQMAKVLMSNPGINAQTLVQMQKLNLPITPEMAAQFEKYMGNHQAIHESMNQFIEVLPTAMSDSTLSADGLMQLNLSMMDIITEGLPVFEQSTISFLTADSGSTMTAQNGEQIILGDISEGVQLILNSDTSAPVNDVEVGNEGIVQGQNADVQGESGQNASGEVISTQGEESQNQVNQVLEELAGTASKSEGLFASGKAILADLFSGNFQNIRTSAAAEETVLKGNGNQEQQPHTLGALLSEKGIENLEKELQSLSKQPVHLTQNTTAADMLAFVKQTLETGTQLEKDMLLKFFGGKEFSAVVRDALQQQWTISPQELTDEEAVNKLYEKMEHKISNLEQVVRAAGVENTAVTQAAADVRGNIEFMNQVNQLYTYVQIPLQMSGQTASGELYVYTNKKNMMEGKEDLTAFLHLDMDNLGSTDVSIRLKGKELSTNFYLDDDDSFALVQAHLPILEARLAEKGYNTAITVNNESKQVNFVEDFLKKDQPSAGQLHRYSFDMRA